MSIQRIAAFGSIIAVVAAVAAGLWLAGSPSEQRLLRFDAQRADNLSRLSYIVQRRWNDRRELPSTLADLVDGQSLSRVPLDPVSDAPYEYRATGSSTFELCAVFDRPSLDGVESDFWFHEAGRRCFSFDVVQPPGR